jgi:hypothetical protein
VAPLSFPPFTFAPGSQVALRLSGLAENEFPISQILNTRQVTVLGRLCCGRDTHTVPPDNDLARSL